MNLISIFELAGQSESELHALFREATANAGPQLEGPCWAAGGRFLFAVIRPSRVFASLAWRPR